MNNQSNGSNYLLKSTTTVGFMTFLSRVMGLVRDIFFARLFGAFPIMDAFFVAFKIPNSFRRFFAEGAFSRAFIPVLSDYEQNKSELETQELIDKTSGTLGIILFLVTLIGVLLAPLLVIIFAPGFFEQQSEVNDRYDIAVDMLRFTFPYLLFISLTAFAGAILNTKKHFWATAINPVILNIVLIIAAGFIAPNSSNPGRILAIAVFIAGLIQLIFLLPFLKTMNRLPRPTWGWNDEGVKRIIKLMIPSMIGSSASQFNLLFNTLIASFLSAGSISWIYYSDRLLEFPVGVFGVALSTVVLPSLARENANKDLSTYKSTLDWGIKLALIISIPSAAGLYCLSGPLISTIFLGGNFTNFDLDMTQYSLMAYSVGLVGLCLVLVLSPAFYSREDTKTPLKYGLIAMSCNAFFSLLLVLLLIQFGVNYPHMGLALAFSMASLLNAYLLATKLIKEKLIQIDKNLIFLVLRILFATLAMIVFLIAFNQENIVWINSSLGDRILSLVFLIGCSVLIYFSVLFLLGFRFREIRIKSEIK
jgi:putative peptidoglycan lipid II flippase